MANRQVGPVAKELIEAKARIADPKTWAVGYRHGIDGSRCALGALQGDLGTGWAERDAPLAVMALARSARKLWPKVDAMQQARRSPLNAEAWVVADFNNKHPNGHAAVMRMYDHAIEQAIKDGV